MGEADDEPKKLLLLLGIASVVVGIIVFCLWPREKPVVSEARDRKLFGAAEEPVTLGKVSPLDGGARGPLSAQEMVRVRSSSVDLALPMKELLAELTKDPELAPTIRGFEASEMAGQPVPARRMLETLRKQGAFGDFLRANAAAPAPAPGLAALAADPDLARLLSPQALPGDPKPTSRKFRSDETITGLVSRELAAAPAGAVPGANAPGSGPGTGTAPATGAQGGPGATGGPGAVGGGAPPVKGAGGNLRGIPGGAPALASWGSQEGGGSGQRSEKADEVLAKYPYLGEVFNGAQLTAMADDFEKDGVWATCLKQKQYARCQQACLSSRPAADGSTPQCNQGGAWSACIAAFRSEQRCIRECKSQLGCDVPPAIYDQHCSAGGFTVPPTYCLGF